jgi:hypothetical protein
LGQVPQSEKDGAPAALGVGVIGLGVDLPLATMAERRCGRICGFEGDI